MKIALVGTGSKAEVHASMLKEIRGVNLCACCDLSLVAARKFAKQFDIADIFIDIDDMLETENLDAVINCTPEYAHFVTSRKIISKGLHILSEAPLTHSCRQSRQLAQMARDKNIVNMLSLNERGTGAIEKARKIIDSGRIGRPLHIEASYLQSWLVADYWGDWKQQNSLYSQLSTESSSYGVLGDMGTALIYTLEEILGSVKTVNCLSRNYSKGLRGNKLNGQKLDSADSAVLAVEFKEGAIGAVHITRWATGCLDRIQLRVFGDEGSISLKMELNREPKLMICSGSNRNSGEWKELRYSDSPHTWSRFINAIRQKKLDTQPDFETACRIQRLIKKTLEEEKK